MGNHAGGRGTTRLHLDVTDAANILTWAPAPDEPGAIWHIFDRHDTTRVRQAIRALGLCSTEVDPIHSQSVYLGDNDLAAMAERFKVRPWTIRQRVGDLIVVPAGSLHQVTCVQHGRIPYDELIVLAPGMELARGDQGGQRFHFSHQSALDRTHAHRVARR